MTGKEILARAKVVKSQFVEWLALWTGLLNEAGDIPSGGLCLAFYYWLIETRESYVDACQCASLDLL